MKNRKLLSAALLLAVSITAAGCGSDSSSESSASSAAAEDVIQSAVEAAQQSEAESLTWENLGSNEGADLSEYEELYTFTLGGEEYTLSCPMQELFDNGWKFSNSEITMDGSNKVTMNEAIQRGALFDSIEIPDYTMYNTIDGTTYSIMMGMYSDSNEQKTLGEYSLGYLYVKEEYGIDFVLASGITFGDSEEAVREVYGEPASEAEGVLSYSFTDDEVALMPNRPEFLNFYVNDGKVYMISMQYFPVLSK